MLERDLVHIVVAALQRDFPTAVVQKNHGEQFQQKGRPDLEGSIYGRHFVLELKAGSYPSTIQQTTISRYSKAGSITGLIVYHENSDGIYYVHPNLCKKFSYRDVKQYTKIGGSIDGSSIDGSKTKSTYSCSTRFLWTWVGEAYMFYVSPQEVWDIYSGR